MNIDAVADALGVGPVPDVAPVPDDDWEDTLKSVVDAVCWMLGSGLTENIYQNALAAELRIRGHVVEVERVIEVQYKNTFVGFLRADLVVDYRAVLEIKSVAKITDAHMAQLNAYLRWLPCKPTTGSVINFDLKGQAEIRTVKTPSVPIDS